MASTDDGVRRGVEGMGTRDGIGSEKPPDARKKTKRRAPNDERAGAEEQVGRLPPHDSRPHAHVFSNATRALEERASLPRVAFVSFA